MQMTIENTVFWRRLTARRANVLYFKWNVNACQMWIQK